MNAPRWTSQDEYEAIHGTQEEQAARQASVGSVEAGETRYELRRYRSDVHGVVTLPNSLRSTKGEVERLARAEFARTGVVWDVVQIPSEGGKL